MNKALRARVKTLNQTASNSEMPVDFNRPASNAVLPEPLQPPVAQSDLSLEIKELRADQMRVSNQLEKVLEQNRQILLRLNSLGQK